jgi:predicted dehydrogenase
MIQSMVIGLGQIGLMYDFDSKRYRPSSHSLAYENHSRIQLLAAADIFPERAMHLANIAPTTKFYSDYTIMLSEHSADMISICTPPQSHYAIIKHIVEHTSTRLLFCEKPVVSDENEARLLMKLLAESKCVLIPNLSRRWSSGIKRVQTIVKNKVLGSLLKIHVRYTRGIMNTGSHIFDLVNWFAGEMERVYVVNQVYTSADQDNDPSFSFHFITDQYIMGFAEAFDDRNYYMFELDLFFEAGKIEIRESGNKINYLHVEEHPLFSGFSSLHSGEKEDNILQESTIQNAVNHLVNILENEEKPICSVRDGLLPIFIAQAIMRSSASQSWEEVNFHL